jgi:hypothetical protein
MASVPQGDAARDFIEELLRAGLALIDLTSNLIETMPERVGEDSAEVLIEMMAGTCRPALSAAGEEECRNATRLIETVWERVMSDLRAAAVLAEPKGHA